MLEILGQAMLIATRMEPPHGDHGSLRARPTQSENDNHRARRRGWLRLTGLRL